MFASYKYHLASFITVTSLSNVTLNGAWDGCKKTIYYSRREDKTNKNNRFKYCIFLSNTSNKLQPQKLP